jgi:hypothetical protein
LARVVDIGGRAIIMSAGEVLLELLTQSAALVVGCGWPLVVFMLILVFVGVFRRDIPKLLARGEVRALGGTFKWGEASADRRREWAEGVRDVPLLVVDEREVDEAGAEPDRAAEPAIKWENTGSLFWLGVDLIWAMDFVLRGAPGEAIGYLVEHLLSYIRSMGLASTEVGAAIEGNLAEIMMQSAVAEEWTEERRNSYATFFLKAAKDIGRLATDNQREHGGWPE